jgi:hypothetical protein
MANTAAAQADIGNGQTLNADAAVYWRLLVAAVAAACGVWVVATEGTRTYARQLYLWVNRNRPGFNPAWHPDDVRANHLSGRAVDVGSGVGYMATAVSRAFYALAGLYGFRAIVPGEPWHFEWRLEWVSPAIRALATRPASTTPIPLTELGDQMIHLKGSANRGEALVGPGYAHSLNREESAVVGQIADKTIDASKNDRMFDITWAMCTQARPRS